MLLILVIFSVLYLLHRLSTRQPSKCINTPIPPSNVVIYVWCAKAEENWFEFRHAVSMKSAIEFWKPDSILFYYDRYPEEDENHYNTWLKEITDNSPFFTLKPFGFWDNGCTAPGHPNPSFIKKILVDNGGIYLKETIILYPDFAKQVQGTEGNMTTAIDINKAKNDVVPAKYLCSHVSSETQKRLQCSSPEQYDYDTSHKPWCVTSAENMFPRDVWELDSRYGELIRRIFYGKPSTTKPVASPYDLVPNIAHIIWATGDKEMDFLFYLCVLSLLHVQAVEAVYIYGESPPTGRYWSLLNDTRIKTVHRQFHGTVYNNPVRNIAHISDVLRTDIMLNSGGIYIDVDAVFVKPLSDYIRGYEAVMTLDFYFKQNRPFPNTLNNGVMLGKKGATFWKLYMESMRTYYDDNWGHNSLHMPYKIKERHPETLHIEPHLQVMCVDLVCLPTWSPEYESGNKSHLNPNSFQTWRNDTHVIQWSRPTPDEFQNHENLLRIGSTTVFGEIGMYLLEKANMLEIFRKMA